GVYTSSLKKSSGDAVGISSINTGLLLPHGAGGHLHRCPPDIKDTREWLITTAAVALAGFFGWLDLSSWLGFFTPPTTPANVLFLFLFFLLLVFSLLFKEIVLSLRLFKAEIHIWDVYILYCAIL